MISSVLLVRCHESVVSLQSHANFQNALLLSCSPAADMATCYAAECSLSQETDMKRAVQGTMCGVHSCQRVAVSWRMASQS